MIPAFVDIHCHLLPAIDDGPRDWDEALAMAQLAASQGTRTIVATPHQLGAFAHNRGERIRALAAELQQRIEAAGIPLRVLPGGEVRVESELIDRLAVDDALTLGDLGRHVLLELPHDVYLPIEPLVAELACRGIVAVLAHPERNQGLLHHPELVAQLVDAGCLLQLTAGSLCGSFGSDCQDLAEELLGDGLVHVVASDGHGSRSRRPLLDRAYDRIASLTTEQTAVELCCRNPARIAAGESVDRRRRAARRGRKTWWARRSVA